MAWTLIFALLSNLHTWPHWFVSYMYCRLVETYVKWVYCPHHGCVMEHCMVWSSVILYSFHLGGNYVLLIECRDSSNNKRDVGETWMEGCNDCTCEETGIPSCKATKCAVSQSGLPALCQLVSGEGDGCCPSRVVCYEGKMELGCLIPSSRHDPSPHCNLGLMHDFLPPVQ